MAISVSTLLQESPTGKLLEGIYEGNFEKILHAIDNNARLNILLIDNNNWYIDNITGFNALSLALERYNETKFGTQLALDNRDVNFFIRDQIINNFFEYIFLICYF